MDVATKVQYKLKKILKRLKGLGIVKTFKLKISFLPIKRNLIKNLLDIDSILKKCLRKIIIKPRRAEIRNVITELIRIKNLNNFIYEQKLRSRNFCFKKYTNRDLTAVPFKFHCRICNQIFNSKKNFVIHKKLHKKSETYLCEKCGAIFHVHTKEKWQEHFKKCKRKTRLNQSIEYFKYSQRNDKSPREGSLRQVPVENLKEISVENMPEAPVENIIEAPAETATEAPVENIIEAPAETATEAPVENIIEAPAETAIEKPVESATEASAETATEAPVETALETPVESATEESAETATEAPVENIIEAPVETATEVPVETAIETPVESATEASAETATGVPVETATEAPVENLTEVPVETALEEAPVKNVTQASGENVKDKSKTSQLSCESLSTTETESADFTQREDLENYLPKSENEKKFICSCGKVFRIWKSLKKHEKLKHTFSDIIYNCPNCKKTFKEKGKLNRHMLSHKDSKYSCSVCSKLFARSDTLKRHLSMCHYISKEFHCSFCPKKFKLKYNRDIHEGNIHRHFSDWIQCEHCGKKFKNKIAFKSHLNVHLKKKITCSFCSKSFLRKCFYENHVKSKHYPQEKLVGSFPF